MFFSFIFYQADKEYVINEENLIIYYAQPSKSLQLQLHHPQ